MNQQDKYESVRIELGDRSYPILIGSGLLDASSTYEDLPDATVAVIVTNTTVGPLFALRLQAALNSKYKKILTVTLPDGEQHKNWQTLNLIFDALLTEHCDRKTVLFALGGGVVGDMTGFAAASYMRGIPFVQLPTTLLSQVDSSVGGKTAINHPLGKNMIGAFYQPLKVVCDIDTLRSLPKRELGAGLAEIIKYGPISDMVFFDWIESSIDSMMACDPVVLSHAIKRSCEIKAWVVSQDERDFGLRAILNFGHTFGHAIETGMGYGTWLHGEAVGCGMVMAANLSMHLGMIDFSFVERLTHLIAKAGLPIQSPSLIVSNPNQGFDNAGRYLELMRGDKKSEGGEIKFVLLDGPGNATVKTAHDSLVRQVIDTLTV